MEEPNYALCIQNCKISVLPEFLYQEILLKSGSIVKILYRNGEMDVIKTYTINGKCDIEWSNDIYKCHLSNLISLRSTILFNFLIAIKESHSEYRIDIAQNERDKSYLLRLQPGKRVSICGEQFHRQRNIDCIVRYIGQVPSIAPGFFIGFIIMNPNDAMPSRTNSLAGKILNYNPALCFLRSCDCLFYKPRRHSIENNNMYSQEIRNLSISPDFRNQQQLNEIYRTNSREHVFLPGQTNIASRYNSMKPSHSKENISNHAQQPNINSRSNLMHRSHSKENVQLLHNSRNNSMYPSHSNENIFQQRPNRENQINQGQSPLIPSLLDLDFTDIFNGNQTTKNTNLINFKENKDTNNAEFYTNQLKQIENQVKELNHCDLPVDILNQKLNNMALELEKVRSKLLLSNTKNESSAMGAKPKSFNSNTGLCNLKSCRLERETLQHSHWNKKTHEYINNNIKKKCPNCRKTQATCLLSYQNKELKEFLNVLNKREIFVNDKLILCNTKVENNNYNILKNRIVTKCSACNFKLASTQGIGIKMCFHIFCKRCIIKTVGNNLKANIKCPKKFENDEQCPGIFQDYEIKAIVDKKLFDYYLKVKDKNKNLFNCQNNECNGVWKIDLKNISKLYSCPACDKLNCYSCKAIHSRMKCFEYLRMVNEKLLFLKKFDLEMELEMEQIEIKENQPSLRDDNEDDDDDVKSSIEYRTPSPDQYSQLLALENVDTIENTLEFECIICLINCKPGYGMKLRECLHEFCKECLLNHIVNNTDAETKCPFYDNIYNCNGVLQSREVKSLLTDDLYEKYLERSIREAQIENKFNCKTPDCLGLWIIDDEITSYKCPICQAENCHHCRAIHKNITCLEYQDKIFNERDPGALATQKMLNDMLDCGDAMRCPSCNIIIARTEGCDWVQCTMCKTEICWVTKGPRWGPLGNGDTSGGCKCGGIRGIKCHPDCGYCH